MLMTFMLVLASLAPQQTPAATPGDCLRQVSDFAAKRQKEAARPLTAAVYRQIEAERTAMAKECAARFDAKQVSASELPDLVQLYAQSGQQELARAAIDHGLQTFSPPQKAALLPVAISTLLRTEPKSDERNARLEKLVDELDAIPDATMQQKFAAHGSLNGYYRGDDIDAGILKHSNWIMTAVPKLSPEQRKQFGGQIISAYRNAAQALAGQGRNDDALALLERAKTDLTDLPNVARSIDPELERYRLVGTPAAAITAPAWLNAPDGTTSMPMTGSVTLLEFTAHWCGPCRESYPGINRLRQKYGARGFRVVLATQLYGYFGTEQELDAAAEIARDRDYFLKHGMDVPVAIGPETPPPTREPDGTMTFKRDPNDLAYKVGGIPQIHLIDRQGRIRLIMVGYDDANEETLGAMIERLMGEK